MIADRPAHLLAQPNYHLLPVPPLGLDFESIPEPIQVSLLQLGGIQPVTGAVAKAAKGSLSDAPSVGEVQFYRERGTRFQMISIVVSLATTIIKDDTVQGIPYAISLIPAQSRGAVDDVSIDFVEKIDVNKYLHEAQPCYRGYDPFKGEWSLYGPVNLLLGSEHQRGYVDEIGLVTDQYFLSTQYDANDLLYLAGGFSDPRMHAKYNKHRENLLFRPFKRIEARRIWGAESPIELFLHQELLRRGLMPVLQMLLLEDGSVYPSLYHLWKDIEFRHAPGVISEADMFFPQQRLAVFCDSTRHHRGAKAAAKDQVISDRLGAVGIKSVRVPGSMIVHDLSAAADEVCRKLA